ncbi:amidohydrolase family protein [Ulvibacterium sp.]|uniref:amidohydrolase family protein n=1 Tax=Ulvibacterium sp. TaxID=2665914 RepID=UPI003CC6223C
MKNINFILAALLLAACNQAQQTTSPTAILVSDVNIVNLRNGKILENQQVVIDSGKIQGISGNIENAESYQTKIAGKGKFMLPGLAEMHAHIPSPPTSSERTEDVLFLYLSNGITTIRGMLGHPSHLELREKAKTGVITSPRIFTSSPSLNGNTVTSREEAISKVTAYQKAGYDFLKIHPGIQLEVFDQIVRTSNEVGIQFAGHVPVDVGIRHALKSKYASIDHVDGFLEGLVPETANVKPDQNGFFGYNFTPLADTTRIDQLVKMSKENKVWIVPTQSLFTRWFAPTNGEELLAQPEMRYITEETLDEWRTRKEQSTGPDSGFDADQWKQFDAIRRQLMKKLQDGGHGMLLGSDAPQLFNVPGFSIHHEIDAMEDAGLTPLEILQSGTINPAIYFGMDDQFGEIKEGLDADVIIVDANPLENLDALQQIFGVMRQGKWHSKEAIDQRLGEIAEKMRNN